jgi:lysophospholipase L1-like esterase
MLTSPLARSLARPLARSLVKTFGGDTFNPADYGTLDVYFDAITENLANNATISTWTDLSGNGRNLTTSAGTLTYKTSGIGTGKGAINMPANAKMATAAFQQWPSLAGTVIMLSTPTASAANKQLIGTYNQTDPDWLWYQTNGTANKGFMGGTFFNGPANADVVNRPCVQAWRRSGATLTLFERAKRQANTVANTQQSNVAFYLGDVGNGAAAEVSALLIYREALTDDQVSEIRAKLIQRYMGKLPVVVTCCGDSITAGYTVGATPYPLQMETKIGFHCIVENLGVSGNGIAQVVSGQIPTANTYATQAYGGRTVYIGFYGTNDINSGTSGATAYAAYASSFASSTAAKKVAVTMLDRTDFDSTEKSRRVAFNDLLRANWHTFADALAEPDLVPELSDPTNATYFPDGVHLSTAGYDFLSTVIANAVNSLGY